MTQPTDTDLRGVVRSAMSGDEVAFGQIVAAFNDDMRRVCVVVTRDEALAEARRAVDLMPLEREFWRGTHRQEELARVYARLGETEDAIDMLETLLSQPGELSAALLRLDPEWDSLRDDPRFQALVEE